MLEGNCCRRRQYLQISSYLNKFNTYPHSTYYRVFYHPRLRRIIGMSIYIHSNFHNDTFYHRFIRTRSLNKKKKLCVFILKLSWYGEINYFGSFDRTIFSEGILIVIIAIINIYFKSRSNRNIA